MGIGTGGHTRRRHGRLCGVLTACCAGGTGTPLTPKKRNSGPLRASDFGGNGHDRPDRA